MSNQEIQFLIGGCWLMGCGFWVLDIYYAWLDYKSANLVYFCKKNVTEIHKGFSETLKGLVFRFLNFKLNFLIVIVIYIEIENGEF